MYVHALKVGSRAGGASSAPFPHAHFGVSSTVAETWFSGSRRQRMHSAAAHDTHKKLPPARAALALPCMTRNTAARCRVMLDTRAAVKSRYGVPALARAPSLHMLAAAGAPADCAALPGTTFLMQPAKCAHAGLRVAAFRPLRTRREPLHPRDP